MVQRPRVQSVSLDGLYPLFKKNGQNGQKMKVEQLPLSNGRIVTRQILTRAEVAAHTLNKTPDHYDQIGSWLDQVGDWNYWCTFTWRKRPDYTSTSPTASEHGGYVVAQNLDNISVPAIRRAMQRYCKKMEVEKIWWVTEAGKRMQRNHVHALMQSDRPPYELWQQAYRWFGHSQVDHYDKKRGASAYLCKYLNKDPNHTHEYWTRDHGYC